MSMYDLYVTDLYMVKKKLRLAYLMHLSTITGISSEVSWRSLRSLVLEKATCSSEAFNDKPSFCDGLWMYKDLSMQSTTRTGKFWLNGVARFLTSLTKVKFLTFFKSTSWWRSKSSVYFKHRCVLESSSRLIQDLCQIPANPVIISC